MHVLSFICPTCSTQNDIITATSIGLRAETIHCSKCRGLMGYWRDLDREETGRPADAKQAEAEGTSGTA